jgi:cyclic beta-1,2-glucan synthetase
MPSSCWRGRPTISRIPRSGKLFVETEFDPQSAALLFTAGGAQRTKSAVWAFHVLGLDGRRAARSNGRPIARGSSARRGPGQSGALDGRALSGTTGAVLDPIAALRERVHLPPARSCA